MYLQLQTTSSVETSFKHATKCSSLIQVLVELTKTDRLKWLGRENARKQQLSLACEGTEGSHTSD